MYSSEIKTHKQSVGSSASLFVDHKITASYESEHSAEDSGNGFSFVFIISLQVK
jgi:hypothetical protein